MATVTPFFWLPMPYIYIVNDQCFQGRGNTICGSHALLVMAVALGVCVSFPILYFTKVLPEIKKQEKELEDEKLRNAFEEIK